MARVTVEDCIEVVPNRFELVALASQRAKDIASGSPLTVERDNDKNAVVALREVAGKSISASALREALIQNSQRKVKTDKFEEDPSLLEDGSENLEIMQEIESLGVKEDLGDMDGMSYDDDNMDVED